jgi:hypothetical protein
LIREKEIRVKYSLPNEHDINNTIKHTRGILITRVIVLKLNSGFPDNISAKYYIVVGYFLNQILTKRIRYRILIGGFLKEIGDTN